MRYLTSTWNSLHQRGIQAILLAGCIFGFGFGQILGASYGPHAYRTYHAQGAEAAAGATSRAGGNLGNNVAAQGNNVAAQQAVRTYPYTKVSTPAVQTQGQAVPLATAAPQQQTTGTSSAMAPPASSGNGHANQSGKGHQKGQNGAHGKNGKGKGNGDKNSPKTQGHREKNNGGPHNKQSKDNGNPGHNKGGGTGHTGSTGNAAALSVALYSGTPGANA